MRLWKALVAALAINGQGQELRALSRFLIDITYYVMCRNCVCLIKEERITIVSTLHGAILIIKRIKSQERIYCICYARTASSFRISETWQYMA